MKNRRKIINTYDNAFVKNGFSPKSLLWTKGRQNKRFQKLLQPIIDKKIKAVNLLDYGCGLGHLYQYLKKKKLHMLNYTGADISKNFIKNCRDRGINAFLVRNSKGVKKKYDIIVCSGVFNLKYEDCNDKNQIIIISEIKKLLTKTKNYLAVDFMRSNVDYVQCNAWHQPMEELFYKLKNHCSNIEIDLRFLKYEYTVRFYK